MHICLIVNARLPVRLYGGTERIVQWLAKEYVQLGHRVTLVSLPGSDLPGVHCIPAQSADEARSRIPADADVCHFHAWEPPNDFPRPWLFTLHGNESDPGQIPAQTVCISADHARRHQRQTYVYNGVDPSEFIYREHKQDYLLFFSKVRRRVKGAARAVSLARRFGHNLVLAGGFRLDLVKTGGFFNSLHPSIKIVGEVGGTEKAELFANAKALVFPIDWEEPFGLVMIEAMLSGTPVLASPRGSVLELVPSQVGALLRSDDEFPQALQQALACSPADCRKWAEDRFTSLICAENYLKMYARVVSGERLQ